MGKKNKFTRSSGPNPSQQQHANGSGSGSKPSKPTHFLCFPIASPSTVPTISASLKHWMDMTTRPPPSRRGQQPRQDMSHAPHSGNIDSDLAVPGNTKDTTTPNTQRPTTTTPAESLKILPPIVTRAAGTWHLTLGVMNLAGEGRMEEALGVLRESDLVSLLREAGSGPPKGFKRSRKWEERQEESVNEQHDTTNVPPRNSEHETTQLKPPDRLTIALTGLGGFPSLKNARVLWACPREQLSTATSSSPPTLGSSTRLYNFGLHILQPFRDAGLVTETRDLALHVTVANMRFAKNRGRVGGWGAERVDASGIGRVWNGACGIVGDLDAEEERGDRDPDTDGHEDEDEDEHERDMNDMGHPEKEFVWLGDVDVNRVAICKLGASRHEDLLWWEWYPAVEGGERLVFEE